MVLFKRLILIVIIATMAATASAWDTLVTGPIAWQSIYQTGEPKSIPEHSTNSDTALSLISPNAKALFGRNGTASLTLPDMNASYFRAAFLEGQAKYGDNEETALEERLIPPPGLFAGLPDYSYAIYDWLNKNQTCPAFQSAEYTPACHDFVGWLGALNSVHFGSQAEKMYAHHHRNAVALAERSRALHDLMTTREKDVYETTLIEAEHLALIYEGYAQHFLQDRWAIGHMWERWGSPDRAQLDRELNAYLAIGAISGLVHGAEAVVNDKRWLEHFVMRADPLSSPLATLQERDGHQHLTAMPMQYVHVRDGNNSEPIDGIGDERLQDATDGLYRYSNYYPGQPDIPLDVSQQVQSFQRCAAAGWAEVIRNFTQDDNAANEFGAYKVQLSESAPIFSVLQEKDCWNMWATNRSMMTGLLGENPSVTLQFFGQLNITSALPAEFGLRLAGSKLPFEGAAGARHELLSYASLMWLYGKYDPDGTQIAQGQMSRPQTKLWDYVTGSEPSPSPPLLGFEPGQAYEAPDYIEPVGLAYEGGVSAPLSSRSPLPWANVRGRDIQTLYGVFNEAYADYWCENRDTLTELRAGTKPSQKELCQRLADFAYQGIHPTYEGVQSRSRQHEGDDIRSLCHIHDVGVESVEMDDRTNPYWIDQGYEPFDPEAGAKTVFTEEAVVANWCERVPVIALLRDADLNKDNVAAQLFADDETLSLHGWDFGEEEGMISLIAADGVRADLYDFVRWTDEEIEVRLGEMDLEPGKDYRIIVGLSNSDPRSVRESPGLFYARVQDELEAEDLAGRWKSNGYDKGFFCVRTPEDLIYDVTVEGDYLTARQVYGDNCFPENQVMWEGTFEDMTITGLQYVIQTSHDRITKPIYTAPVEIRVQDEDAMRSIFAQGGMDFERVD